ncbi:hypothetical protein JCM8097_008816 [Rhodosporidiobolus ruineniae]
METPDTTARAATARLLRVVGALITLVDPKKGVKASLLSGLVNEIKEVAEECGSSLSSDVRQRFTSATSSLTSSVDTFVPYTACLSAHVSLARALQLLAVPSPSSAPPFSKLPVELVAKIVKHCQVDDVRVRQATNLALSRTCRFFRPSVLPILKAEMHLFTPRQLEVVAKQIRADERGYPALKHLTVDVELDAIQLQQDGSWPGRRIPYVVDALLDTAPLETLHVHIRPTPSVNLLAAANSVSEYTAAIEEALALEPDGWHIQVGSVADLAVPCALSIDYGNLFGGFAVRDGVSSIRRLRVGTSGPPPCTADAVEFRHLRILYDDQQAKRAQQGQDTHGFAFETLALPYHLFYPADLLPLVFPTWSLSPTLTHLEVALSISNMQIDSKTTAHILTCLAPSLRRLTLRLVFNTNYIVDFDVFENLVTPALKECTRLEHLKLGGNALDVTILNAVRVLRRLQTLVILSSPDGLDDLAFLPDEVSHFPSSLRSLTLGERYIGSDTLNRLMTACEENEIEYRNEPSDAEDRWYNQMQQ